jgi:hypothetical protein
MLGKDTIKEALFDTLGTGDRAWSRRLGAASYAVLLALARELPARADGTAVLTGRAVAPSGWLCPLVAAGPCCLRAPGGLHRPASAGAP